MRAPFPCRFTPDPEHIEVIEYGIADPPDAEAVRRLSAEELARAERFHFERDRSRFIRARSGLRTILGACLGRDPASLRLQDGTRGKPRLAHAQSDLRFNLSHSEDRALVGVALGRELGVDLELIHDGVDHVGLARSFFTSFERDAVLHHGGGSLRGFFRCWVAKEAYLKARGDGIQVPLDAFEVDVENEADCLRWSRFADCRRWSVDRVPVDGPYVAAVAVERGRWTVRRWEGLPQRR